MDKNKLKEYRRLAEDTMMVSALGEYTPLEFTELLDYIDQLHAQIREVKLQLDGTKRPVNRTVTHGLSSAIEKLAAL
jgi:hypothetical protein